MIFRSLILQAGALLVLTGSFAIAQAQTPIDVSTLTPLVTGLEGPRGLKFGPDGLLYVAEAGLGGNTNSASLPCLQVGPPGGPYHGGPTGRISQIGENGTRTTVAYGLPSAKSSFPTGDILGPADVAFLDGKLYALLAGGGCSHGNLSQPNGIVRINRQNGSWNYVANLSDLLQQYPAAYPGAVGTADFEPDGSPYSLVAHKGKLYMVEPNHGQIFWVTPDGRAGEAIDISKHEGHIVPTAAAWHNGNLYVGNLGRFPVTPQWEKVMTLSDNLPFLDDTPGLGTDFWPHTLRIASSRAGFTNVVGLAFGPDGLAYVLELSTAANVYVPGTGKVVRVQRDGTIEDVVTGLTFPTGMTFGPDRALYVSNFGGEAGTSTGQILKINVQLSY